MTFRTLNAACTTPMTISPVAGPFTCCSAEGISVAPGMVGIGAGAAPGNGGGGISSGKSARVRHSVEPSAMTRDCAFKRPSLSHCRTWSAGIGPYSLSSAPMIRYIGSFSENVIAPKTCYALAAAAQISKRNQINVLRTFLPLQLLGGAMRGHPADRLRPRGQQLSYDETCRICWW